MRSCLNVLTLNLPDDVVCPIFSAWALHRAWPEAEYIIVPDAGHSAWEPGIAAELVKATERFKNRV